MLWENNVYIMNIISTVKVKFLGAGKEAEYDFSASLSLALHRTPPPFLPPSGSNPGHCQELSTPDLFTGEG